MFSCFCASSASGATLSSSSCSSSSPPKNRRRRPCPVSTAFDKHDEAAAASPAATASPPHTLPNTPMSTSFPSSPSTKAKLSLVRQTTEDDYSMDSNGSFRRLTARASRNSEFFSQLAPALQEAEFLSIIVAKAETAFCAEVFKFIAALLEMEEMPAGRARQGRALEIIELYVREGALHENNLSCQARAGLLEFADNPALCLSEDEIDLLFLAAKIEVIEDVKLNPALRQIALSCLGGEPGRSSPPPPSSSHTRHGSEIQVV